MHKITWENKGQHQGKEVLGEVSPENLPDISAFEAMPVNLPLGFRLASGQTLDTETPILFPISCHSRRSFWFSKKKKKHLTLSFLDIRKKCLLKYLQSYRNRLGDDLNARQSQKRVFFQMAFELRQLREARSFSPTQPDKAQCCGLPCFLTFLCLSILSG